MKTETNTITVGTQFDTNYTIGNFTVTKVKSQDDILVKQENGKVTHLKRCKAKGDSDNTFYEVGNKNCCWPMRWYLK